MYGDIKKGRGYVRFRESDSFDEPTDGTFSSRKINRFGEERVRHDSYQDDQYKHDYDPTYEDEYGMRHPAEHGGQLNRWSDDYRSEASHESHAGKGPKGYKRSSERIREEACELLSRDWYLDATDIEVSVEDDCLILKGEVKTRKDKRHAEALVENVPGVRDVLNQIKVVNKVEGWIPGIGHVKQEVEKNGGQNG